MTPEQKSREWAVRNAPILSDSPVIIKNEVKLYRMAKRAYLAGHREALTSLLDELPEVEDDTRNDYNLGRFNGQEAYRENIINLIQNKLK